MATWDRFIDSFHRPTRDHEPGSRVWRNYAEMQMPHGSSPPLVVLADPPKRGEYASAHYPFHGLELGGRS